MAQRMEVALGERLAPAERVLNACHGQLGNHLFAWWLDHTRLLEVKDGVLRVAVSSEKLRRRVETTMVPRLEGLEVRQVGRLRHIELEVCPEEAPERGTCCCSGPEGSDRTLDTFVHGSSNQLAVRACQEIARTPAGLYNPVLFHGRHGCGKTHLMQGVARKMQQQHPGKRVVLTGGPEFTRAFTASLYKRQVRSFRSEYRQADVLLLDDLDSLESKQATQQELLYTVEALLKQSKQVCVSSHRDPRGLGGPFSQRLKGILASGLVIQVRPPDYQTRLAIVVARANRERVSLKPSTLQLAARRLNTDVRTLLKGYQRLSILARGGREPDAVAVRLLLDAMRQGEDEIRPQGLAAISEAVARHFEVEAECLTSRSQKKKVVRSRQVAMYLARELTGQTLKEIGAYFGRRSSSTVNHAVRRVEELSSSEPTLKQQLDRLADELQAVAG